MIQNSFIFLEKVGEKKEKSLWKQGIKNWDDFLNIKRIKGIPLLKKQYYDRKIKEARQALCEENPSYFVGKLPSKEMWRLYDYFRDQIGFLDIEIDSLGKIILVGISDYYNSNFFVKGANLEKEQIQKSLAPFKLLITFNGSAFDLPKLKKQLGIEITIPHIDLKPACINLGLRGGLKEIEITLNLKRPAHLRGNPVDLWKAFHASGDKEYLELLIEYNREDIENLKMIMDTTFKILARRMV